MKMQIALNKRLHIGLLPLVLLALMGIAFVIAMVRYVSGIGAISNLSNSYPWGFWISFDLFTGVAISSGGFLMAATVYIFELKQFKPLLRPSILTAFLGYIMVVIALLVDLGHPERIWYMMIHMNGTSVLLEIGICVMTYLTVLAIEFAPVVVRRAEVAEVCPLHPPLYHAVRDPGRGAFHPAPILAGIAAADPTCQTLPALVDADIAGALLYLRHHHRVGHDHPRIFAERALLPARPGNPPAGKTGPGHPDRSGQSTW